MARKFVREDQIKEHIKHYGHYGPHSPNRKKLQKNSPKNVFELKAAAEIPIVFEAWSLEGDIHPPTRTLIYKKVKTNLTFKDDVDEQYLTHTESESSPYGRYFCSMKNCYFNEKPPHGLLPLSFSSFEYLRQHQRRTGHASPNAAEGNMQSFKSFGSHAEIELNPQDARYNTKLDLEPLTKAPDSQVEMTNIPTSFPDLDFSLSSELMSRTRNGTPYSLTLSQPFSDFLFEETVDTYSSMTAIARSSSALGDTIYSSTMSPTSFELEVEKYSMPNDLFNSRNLSTQNDLSYDFENDPFDNTVSFCYYTPVNFESVNSWLITP